MAKVKIQTTKSSNFGQTIDFNSIELTFDKLGFAEVDSMEIAEKLQAAYPNWLYVNAKPKMETKNIVNNPDEDLVRKLDNALEKIKDREATIEAFKNENKEWKNELEKTKEELVKLKSDHEGYVIQKQKEIKELDLQIKLMRNNTKDLIDVCVTLEIPEERYKNKNKDELINIILDESRDK